MRQIYLQLFALLVMYLLTGCTRQQVIDQSIHGAIAFETHIGKNSKAATQDAFNEGDTFMATCIVTDDRWDDPTQTPTPYRVLMSDVEVTKGAAAWSYGEPIYWQRERYHSFFGYSPRNIKHSKLTVENGVPELTYAPTTTALQQQDLLVSKAQFNKQYSEGSDNKVKFEFVHALSQVKFSARLAYDNITNKDAVITGITINAIMGKGATQLNQIGSNGSVAWNLDKTLKVNYQLGVKPGVVLNTTNQSVTATDGMLMLLPQSLKNQKVTIYYTVDGAQVQSIQATITAGEWVNNTIYHYYLTLDLSQDLGKPIIIGDPTVIEWEKESIENLDPPPASGSLHVTVPDAREGANGKDNNSRFTVIMPNEAKQAAEFSLTSSGDILYWIAEIVAYEGQPTDWLKIAESADGSGAGQTTNGPTDRKKYAYIAKKHSSDATQNRTALIKITPRDGDNQTPRYISVTQESGLDIRYVNDADGERYEIYTAKGLSMFANWINNNEALTENAKLINDINIAHYEWTPIGNGSRAYSGVFDGNDKTITGMQINSNHDCGLFGIIRLGMVKNLKLDRASIKMSEGVVGTFAGMIENGAMINCSSTNFDISARGIIGGLVGSYQMHSNSANNQPKSIIACAATNGKIEFTAERAGLAVVGGLVGENLGSLVFCSYSRNNTITDISTAKVSIGGVVGVNNTKHPSNNAYVSSSVVTDCYSDTKIVSPNSKAIVGSIVGSQIRTNGVPMITYCASVSGEGNNGVGQNHKDGIVSNTVSGASPDKLWKTIHTNNQQIYLDRLPDGKGGLLSLGQMWKRKTSNDLPVLHWESFDN